MTLRRSALLSFAAISLFALVMAGPALASHLLPAKADVVFVKLVENYRQTISPSACTASASRRRPGTVSSVRMISFGVPHPSGETAQ